MALCFAVPPERDGWCVRDFLRDCGVSSTAIRAAKRTPPGILADGVPVHTNVPVKAGMRIALPEVPEASPEITPQAIPLDIVREDDEEAFEQDYMEARIAILYSIGYLYEHREEADHHDLVMTLRNLLSSVREGVF